MKILDYDTDQYPFQELINEWFIVNDLSRLHEVRQYELFTRENDQKTMWHKKFYELIRGDEGKEFYRLYLAFLSDIIYPEFDEALLYQKVPTFRVNLPDNVAVGEFHRDRDYSHQREERNQFLPLTRAYETNTVWVESEDGKADYSPVNLEYGQVALWDGMNLMHGNKTNRTGDTRVSFDFRVIPVSVFRPSKRMSVNQITSMDIGGYWEPL